jgi:outer membrane protein
MKVFAVVLALSLVLSAAPGFTQAQAPAQPAGAAQAPAPTAKPAPPPAAAQPQAPPRVPFQTGLKYAFVQLQAVAAESVQGKAFDAKVRALQEQRLKELQDKNKVLLAAQEKLEKGATVLNDAARASLQADIEKQQRDYQRASEDAQQELQTLTQQLQQEFYRLVQPAIERVAKEKQLHFVFDAEQSGLVWAEQGMDLTMDVVKALDAAATTKPPAPVSAQKPPAAPAPAAPAPTQK